MRHLAKKILRSVLPIVVLLISSQVFAQEQSKGDQTTGAKQDVAVSAPDLADMIPKAAKLSGELAILENRVREVLDVSELEKNYARIEESLKGPAAQLQLNSMPAVQERAGNIQTKIFALITEVDSLILTARPDVRDIISPPMFSSRYVSQLGSGLWYAV